ncbi:hypothetical protein [Paraburkholderia sp. RL17-347-BIC-D]|jgi:hypothetical protein
MNLDTGLVVSQREIRQFNLGNARLVAKARAEPKRGPERRAHGADLLVTFEPALAVRPDESARFCVKAPTFGKIDDRIRL